MLVMLLNVNLREDCLQVPLSVVWSRLSLLFTEEACLPALPVTTDERVVAAIHMYTLYSIRHLCHLEKCSAQFSLRGYL